MEKEIKLDRVKAVLDEYASEFQFLVKKHIKDNDNVATGKLLESISTSVEVNGEKYKVILHSEDYLKYLEDGTRPHWPPSEPILEWVRAKKLPTRESTGDRSLPREKSVAWFVRKKISEEGTEARHNIFSTQQELNAVYMEKLREALIEDIKAWIPVITIQIRYE